MEMRVRVRGGVDRYHLRPRVLQALPTLGAVTKIEKKRKLTRGCRKKQRIAPVIPAESRPWADLPKELLHIFSKSDNLSVADFLNFGKVCRSWRLFYTETKNRFMASRPPLVIYISTRAKKSCHFYEITTSPNTYQTKLPYFARNFCIGFSNGYLIMEDLLTNVWVINPITGHELKYPRLLEARNFLYCPDRAVFASIGDSQDNFLLAVLSPVYHKLMFFVSRVNRWQQFSYRGKTWSILDIVVSGGRIYCITSEYQIGVLSVKTGEVILLNLKGSPQLSGIGNVRFVASKNQQLLIVDLSLTAYHLEVYTIDLLKMVWVKVNRLADEQQAIFLGDRMSSRLSNATSWGGQSNCVYHLPFMDNTCYIYSLDGKILGSFPIMKQKAAPRMNGWFFPDQSFIIENVRDE